jgi:SAM-dependent methyltransferase
MSFWVPDRRPADEILDGDVPAPEAEASLSDIEWVHRNLGGRILLARRLLPLLSALAGSRGSLSLLDLGCGSGHVGRDLLSAFARRGGSLRAFGLDLKLTHARLSARGRAAAADALALPFGDRSVDVVFSTLFLHHFSPAEIATLLAEAERVARRAVVSFDLTRHRIPLALISVVGPLAFRSRISTVDGQASVRQAYTREEMGRLALPVLPGATLAPAGPFVWQLVWIRP